MYVTIDSNLSCGVVQVAGLSSAPFKGRRKPALLQLRDALNNHCLQGADWYDHEELKMKDIPARPFFVWSDNSWQDNAGGKRLYEAIKLQGNFGEIWRSKLRVNRNTGNRICLYTWMPSKHAHKFFGWNTRTKKLDY